MCLGLLLTLIIFLFQFSKTKGKCIGLDESSNTCYECSYSFFRSPNMTVDQTVFQDDCKARNAEKLKLELYISSTKCKSKDLCKGTVDLPFDEINQALFFAHSLANERIYSELDILFLGGPHYVLKKNSPQDNYPYFRRINVSITIKPCFCSFKNVSGCYNENDSVLIYIKTDTFNVYISRSLIMKNLIINGSDIHYMPNTANACMNQEKLCCNQSSKLATFVSLIATPCSLYLRLNSPNPFITWKIRSGFLNLDPILDDPENFHPILLISNLVFTEINILKTWYSLVLMPSDVGVRLEISNTLVENCRFTLGVISSEKYQDIITNSINVLDVLDTKSAVTSTINITALQINNYNRYQIDFTGRRFLFAIISFIEFPGKILINETLITNINQIKGSFLIMSFKNCPSVKIEKLKLLIMENSTSLYTIGCHVEISNCLFSNMKSIDNFIFKDSSVLVFTNNVFKEIESTKIQFPINEYLVSTGFFISFSSRISIRNITFQSSSYIDITLVGNVFDVFNLQFDNIYMNRPFINAFDSEIFMDVCVFKNSRFESSLDILSLYLGYVNPIQIKSLLPVSCSFTNFYIENLIIPATNSFIRYRVDSGRSLMNLSNISVIYSDLPFFLKGERIDSFKLSCFIFENHDLNNDITFSFIEASEIGHMDLDQIFVRNIVLENKFIAISKCYLYQTCVFKLNNLTMISIKAASAWLKLSLVTHVLIKSITFNELVNANLEKRKYDVFIINLALNLELKEVNIQNISNSIRTLIGVEQSQNITVENLFIDNYDIESLLSDIFITAMSLSKNNKITLKGIHIKGLMGFPQENSIYYKNGFINIFGFESDIIRRKLNNSVEFFNVEISQCKNWPYGVIGLSNIEKITAHNITFSNTSSAFRGGTFSIFWAGIVDLSNITIADSATLIEGGAFYIKNIDELEISSVIIYNSNSLNGAGIYIFNVELAVISELRGLKIRADNKGGLLYLEKGNFKLSQIYCQMCSSKLEGGVIYQYKGTLELQAGRFVNLESENGGFIAIINSTNVTFSEIEVNNSFAFGKGVVAYFFEIGYAKIAFITLFNSTSSQSSNGNFYVEAQDQSTYIFNNIYCVKGEIPQGACFYFYSNGRVVIHNALIAENKGSIVYYFSNYKAELDIKNISMISNFAGSQIYEKDNLWHLINIDVKLSGTNKFVDNKAKMCLIFFDNCTTIIETIVMIDNVGIIAYQPFIILNLNAGILSLTNITKKNPLSISPKYPQSFLYASDARVDITKSAISDCLTVENQGCVILVNTSSNLNNIAFENNKGERVGSISVLSSNVTIQNCNFSKGLASMNSSLINIDINLSNKEIKASDILLENYITSNQYTHLIKKCQFQISNEVASITIFKFNNFRIEDSVLLGGSTASSGIFSFSSNITVKNTAFENLKDPSGGAAIKFFNFFSSSTSFLFIYDSIFRLNQSPLGGVLLMQGYIRSSVSGSLFEQNSATGAPGIGAVIFYTCLICNDSSLMITNNKWLQNSAENFGSTILSQAEITAGALEHNIFSENKDKFGILGPISFPISIIISPLYDSNTNSLLVREPEMGYDTIVSGRDFDFNITLVDKLGQRLEFENESSSSLKKLAEDKIQITGGLAQSEAGIHMFKRVKVNINPNTRFTLIVDIKFDESLVLPRVLENNKLNNISMRWSLYARPCIVGEIFIEADSSCFQCPEGEFSLNDPSVIDENIQPLQTCLACVDGAHCPGGSALIPLAGFWRAHNKSAKVVKCLSPDSCLGGLIYAPSDNERVQGRCLINHEGALCYKCSKGFARSGNKGMCEICSINAVFLTKLLIPCVLVLIYILLQVKFNYSKESRNHIGILMKQMLTHLQLAQMISLVELGWTLDFLDLFKYQEYISFLSEDLISIDCIYESINEEILNLRVIAAYITPFAVITAILIIIAIYHAFLSKRKKLTKPGYKKTVIVIVFYIFFPEILRKSFSMMNCSNIDDSTDSKVLQLSPETVCWEAAHIRAILAISIPGIVFWAFLIPIITLALLRKNKKQIQRLIKKRQEILGNSEPRREVYFDEVIKSSDLGENKNLEDFQSPNTENRFLNQPADTIVQHNTIVEYPSPSYPSPSLSPSPLKPHDFETDNCAVYLKFIYRGYKAKFYYWEAVIFLKKLAMIVFTSLSNYIPNNLKPNILLIIICLFLFLQARSRPYEFKSLNHFEMFSLLIIFLLANAGIILYSEDLKTYSFILLISLVVLNILFLCFWLWLVIKEIIKEFKFKKKRKADCQTEMIKR